MASMSRLKLFFILSFVFSCCVSGLLGKQHAVDGAARWLRQYIGHVKSASVDAQHAFVRTDKEIASIVLNDGSLDWRREIVSRQVVRTAEQIITLSDNAVSSWCKSSGQKLWETRIDSTSANSICSHGGDTYVVSGGQVSALTSTGALKWTSDPVSQHTVGAVCTVYNGTVRVGVAVCSDGLCGLSQATFDSQTGVLRTRTAVASAQPLLPNPAGSPDFFLSQAGVLTQTDLVILSPDLSTVCVLGKESASLACTVVPVDDGSILNAQLQATPKTALLTIHTDASCLFFNVVPSTKPLLRRMSHHLSAVSSAYLLQGRYARTAAEKVSIDGVLRIVTLDADTGESFGDTNELVGYPAVHTGNSASQPKSIWVSEGHLGSMCVYLSASCFCAFLFLNYCVRCSAELIC